VWEEEVKSGSQVWIKLSCYVAARTFRMFVQLGHLWLGLMPLRLHLSAGVQLKTHRETRVGLYGADPARL
jgi:hypothetical protein